MRIQEIEWIPYSVPFVKPFETAHGSMYFREGLLLKIMCGQSPTHLTGWGEVAPLPDFGEGGNLAHARLLLTTIAPTLKGLASTDLLEGQLDSLLKAAIQKVQVTSNLEITAQTQSVVCFGLELALYDILAQANHVAIAAYWGASIVPIAVNATIGTPELEEAVMAATSLARAGYKCVKLKVGMITNECEEIARVAAVRQALDNVGIGERIRLRLDANEAWTLPQAVRLLKQLAQYDLELVEQPVAGADITGLAQVRRETGVTIAADEAVTSVQAAHELIKAQAAQVLVIKPSLVGGVRATREIINLAEAAGLQGLITTALDTGVGIAGAFHLALTLKRPALACGLATAPLLTDTLVTNPLRLEKGWMWLPAISGLGVTPKIFETK